MIASSSFLSEEGKSECALPEAPAEKTSPFNIVEEEKRTSVYSYIYHDSQNIYDGYFLNHF